MLGVVGDEDLLTEILLRLPVKDLLRCKGVCKQWKCLISETQFCYRHTLGLCRKHKHKHNPFLYSSGIILSPCPCRPSLRTLEKVHIIPFSRNNDNRIIHLDVHNKFDEQLENSFLRSCNGLLLLKSSPKEFGVQQGSFYVSNLTTGDCVRIDPFGHQDASLSKLYLAFEAWKSPHYKVIFFDKVVGDRDDELTTKIKDCYYLRVFGRNLRWNTFKFGIWEFDIWESKEDYSGWILRYYVDLTTLQFDLKAYSFDEVLGVVYQPPKEDEEEEFVLVMIFVL
ncbi:hypothetical protein PIB30_064901 [Stylosanthes scabra]|uniref:F-box domain-containing protein n=1 Tax=Stylosanthes scabra TaxID=79078 RepID=A0ABU6ZKK1_9FABA|nr:hypothetical protein [Stylosanthes scabra]